MTIQDMKQSYGICGLVCAFCAGCAGCQCEEGNCDVKACCTQKGLRYCFECNEWPCNKDVHKGIRTRAFNTVAQNEGLDQLAEYLYTNDKRGIIYHRADGLSGDYDKYKTEQAVIDLLRNGKPDPYEVCPTYESKSFILRLVSIDDAADLLECYRNPTVSVQANSANCDYGYGSQTLDEMQNFIERWLEEYRCRSFVRFSIINKQENKTVGTVEIFDGGHRGHSILRIDLLSAYENAGQFDELLRVADCFFYDFGTVDQLVTKAVPDSVERIDILTRNGYIPYPVSGEWEHKDYYVKRRPQ